MVERLREEGFRRAMIDSDRLLEKYLMVFDPEFAVLRQKDVNVNIRAVIQQQFRDLPTELLEQLLHYLDERSGETQEIVEGEYAELPAGGNDDNHWDPRLRPRLRLEEEPEAQAPSRAELPHPRLRLDTA